MSYTKIQLPWGKPFEVCTKCGCLRSKHRADKCPPRNGRLRRVMHDAEYAYRLNRARGRRARNLWQSYSEELRDAGFTPAQIRKLRKIFKDLLHQ